MRACENASETITSPVRKAVSEKEKNFVPLACRPRFLGYYSPPSRGRRGERSLTTWLVTPRVNWESAFVWSISAGAIRGVDRRWLAGDETMLLAKWHRVRPEVTHHRTDSSESSSSSSQFKGLILAQSERWRRGLGMQVERS